MAVRISFEYDQGQFARLRDKLNFVERKQVLWQTVRQTAEFIAKKLRDEQPPYKYVSRQQAFGVTFFSDRQRRYFFWALREGIINVPYRRTGALAAGWKVDVSGTQATVTNAVPSAPYVQSRPRQSRMMTMIGWPTVEDYVDKYEGEIGRIAFGIVQQAIEED